MKGTAAGAAGIAAIGVLGCTNMAATGDAADVSEQAAAPAHNPQRTETCDIVVVGSGTAGMCATVRAAELGAKVIQLEKNSQLGGSSRYAEGVGAIASSVNKALGQEFTVEDVHKRCMAFCHNGADAVVLKTFMRDSAATIDWLAAAGVQFTAAGGAPLSYPTWHLVTSDNGPLIGEAVIDVLDDYLHTMEVDQRLSTPATGLIIEDGAVRGVYVGEGDEEYAIEASKAVILATGGYSNNKEMFERFSDQPFDRFVNQGFEGRDGDGIAWALEAGAALHNASTLMYAVPLTPASQRWNDLPSLLFGWQSNLRVNQLGKRFHDENVWPDFTPGGNAMVSQEKVYSLLDTSFLSDICEKAIPFGADLYGYPTGQPVPEAIDVVEAAVAEGKILKGESLEDLAAQMGVDAAVLTEQIETYNASAASGTDENFGTPAEMMRPMVEAPFYAALMTPTIYTSCGGLKVDECYRVVSTEGTPIEGLYALGNDASSIHGRDYDCTTFSGEQQGWCATGGKRSVEIIMGV